jgi:hypothetical protein
MYRTVKTLMLVLLSLALLSASSQAYNYGSGVRSYVPSTTTFVVDSLPFIYNGSFVVHNDGYRDGVYIIRVSVSEPAAINWLDLSESAFTLRPGESRLINFNINVSPEEAVPGEIDYVIMPTLLNTNVEPYLDDFASYLSRTDPFTLKLVLPGSLLVSTYAGIPPGTPVVFYEDNRSNLQQYSVLVSNDTILTQLDRAVKLNTPEQATVGTPVSFNVSIFEGLSDRGLSMMAVSPNGTLYRMANGTFTFDREGLWGIMVLVGDEFLLGKPVNVVSSGAAGLLAIPDTGTILAAASLLVLLAVVPIWILAGRQMRAEEKDPYSDILFKTYVVRKYITQFDKSRLERVVQVLKNEYYDLVARGAKGKKDEAKSSIDELGTLANLE